LRFPRREIILAATPDDNQPTTAVRLARLREQCRLFQANFSAEDRASFDALLREASRFIQARALDPSLMLSEVLAVAGQLDAFRACVSDLEEQLKDLEGWQ
jgi:hypothetical protein